MSLTAEERQEVTALALELLIRPYLLGQAINGLLSGRSSALPVSEVANKVVHIVDKVMELEAKKL